MVAIDVHNGYRDILLPLSEYDETLRFAILAASAFHLAHQHPDPKWTSIARNYHMATINGLNQRSREQKENHITSDTFSNLSIMVVLLIEEMVTVGEDFPILLGMVRSFVSSRGGEEKLKETPLVSELSATTNLCNISATDLALLYSFQQTTPEWGTIIANIVDFVRKAAEIYLLRATNMPDALIHDQVQHFINAASLFNATSFGGHVLIWPFFIVGAECSDIRHREFIVTQLRYLWGCTGFANTLYAIRLLKKIWEDQSGMNWTKILVNNVEGFVM
ncbi:hypothetical protein N7467_001874 [Penicillium canescens]|nr:hypothetical protein N7467_001874 [Penicillium canescens]